MSALVECSNPIKIQCEQEGHDGHISYIRCGSRVASKCRSCSELYRQDARAIIYSGLDNSASMFITLTAPSFGATHLVPSKKQIPRRCRCGAIHPPNSELKGVPVDLDKYDYERAVTWNLNAGKLWDRFKTELNRIAGSVKVDYIKVAEWQARGSIHLHVLVKGVISKQLIEKAANSASVYVPGHKEPFKFGKQLDVRLIPANRNDGQNDKAKLGGYIAKLVTYVLKDLAADSPEPALRAHVAKLTRAAEKIRHDRADRLASSCLCDSHHAEDPSGKKRVTCKKRPKVPQERCHGYDDCRSALHRQAGWRGHVLSKSRYWSEKTFTTERQARRDHARSLYNVPVNEEITHDWVWAELTDEEEAFVRDSFHFKQTLLVT